MLKINNLSVKYGKKKIIDDLSFEFKRGEVSVITGKSGSGKTSILKAINGVVPYFINAELSGEIYLDGTDISKDNIVDRSDYTSSVFQNPKTQFFTVRTEDEIAFGLENQNMPSHEIIQTIDKYTKLLGTSDLLNRNIFDLSGGQKQILAVTSVVALDKDIYLFDEPSASLDIDMIGKLTHAINYLKSKGKIIIIVEHRLFYLKEIMETLYIIENSKVVKVKNDDIDNKLIKEYNLRTINNIDIDKNVNYVKNSMFNKQKISDYYLRCVNYSFKYTKQDWVFNMNYGFNQGIHFIIGKNGVGKTTFIRSLCGLNKMKKSESYIENKKIKRNYEYVSLVMQDVNYQIFTESVYKEISIVSDDENLKEATLKQLGLWEDRDNHPQSLSGGQKQRLLFGLCMCSNKPIVVLDEPTSGLCKHNMDIMIDNIKKMESQGKTVIIVTHDHEFISNCGGTVHEFES